MKILSIDVGIKNLAFCLFEKPQGSQHVTNRQSSKKKTSVIV